jgi:hypothetical protein
MHAPIDVCLETQNDHPLRATIRTTPSGFYLGVTLLGLMGKRHNALTGVPAIDRAIREQYPVVAR